MAVLMIICNLFGENQVQGDIIAEQVRENCARPNTHLGFTLGLRGFDRVHLLISITIKHTYKSASKYSSRLLNSYDYIVACIQISQTLLCFCYSFTVTSQLGNTTQIRKVGECIRGHEWILSLFHTALNILFSDRLFYSVSD